MRGGDKKAGKTTVALSSSKGHHSHSNAASTIPIVFAFDNYHVEIFVNIRYENGDAFRAMGQGVSKIVKMSL